MINIKIKYDSYLPGIYFSFYFLFYSLNMWLGFKGNYEPVGNLSETSIPLYLNNYFKSIIRNDKLRHNPKWNLEYTSDPLTKHGKESFILCIII